MKIKLKLIKYECKNKEKKLKQGWIDYTYKGNEAVGKMK